ncbi:hypothetical protein K2173_025290 [Erythroxylum novogranatense]|uniref:Ripening-related protein 1 n=1 Tax=Erythroxylum novogranatense TaxID=1862640 RepID=A0AAV8UDI9_9ROSI|nr:hypothetical protein K2173_025290 [Erythroxylum novogranatense]
MKNLASAIIFIFLFVVQSVAVVEAATCNPSGDIKGKKPPPGQCNRENDSDCCVQNKRYPIYKCSPPVSDHTKATLTLNSFQKGGDGGGPSECDNQYHPDDEPVVALSTGWFDNRSRCLKYINIHGNGKSVRAKVVDECDSTMGCDSDHDYQPPCANDVVDASKAVWEALGVPEDQRGEMDLFLVDSTPITYRCSPPVANQTKATLTLNSFEKGGDGSSPSKCDGRYHSDDETVVALSTGWFNHRSRCLKFINIHGSNGENVKAKVVDECDSANGCDSHHDYQPPCGNHVVVASMAVWKALKVPVNQWGDMDIYWSDA